MCRTPVSLFARLRAVVTILTATGPLWVTGLSAPRSVNAITSTAPPPAERPGIQELPRTSPLALETSGRAILEFGGRLLDPGGYPATVTGFERYLEDTGVEAVTADEMTRPNHPGIAAKLGYQEFLPPREWWTRGAALALLAQQIEERVSEPVRLRNWWRPADYNRHPGVGGAKGGDHPTAHAIDLDYSSVESRKRAERWLRDLDSRARWLELSLGLGAKSTHIGIGSPHGRREWHYAGWS